MPPHASPSNEPAEVHRSRSRPAAFDRRPVVDRRRKDRADGSPSSAAKGPDVAPPSHPAKRMPATATATATRAGPRLVEERRRSSPKRLVGAWIVRRCQPFTTRSCGAGRPSHSPANPGRRSGISRTPMAQAPSATVGAMDLRIDRARSGTAGRGARRDRPARGSGDDRLRSLRQWRATDDERRLVVVAEVQSRSIAAQSGLEAGMVVIELHGVRLIQMPQYLDPDPAMPSPDPETGEIPPYEPTLEPKAATRIDLDPGTAGSAPVPAGDLARGAPALGPVRDHAGQLRRRRALRRWARRDPHEYAVLRVRGGAAHARRVVAGERPGG